MTNKTKEQIEREEELLEVIKSHLFESLDVLKNLELKKEKAFCDDCKEIFNSKKLRIREGKKRCYCCHVKKYPVLFYGNKDVYIPEEDKPLILKSNIDSTKQSQPIIDDVVLPITEPSAVKPTQIIKINLLEGLNEKQINFIKSQVDIGANPMGFTIYTNTGEIYYFGTFLGVIK